MCPLFPRGQRWRLSWATCSHSMGCGRSREGLAPSTHKAGCWPQTAVVSGGSITPTAPRSHFLSGSLSPEPPSSESHSQRLLPHSTNCPAWGCGAWVSTPRCWDSPHFWTTFFSLQPCSADPLIRQDQESRPSGPPHESGSALPASRRCKPEKHLPQNPTHHPPAPPEALFCCLLARGILRQHPLLLTLRPPRHLQGGK